ncbi:MAG: rod shape-determining protein MreD [Syntrophobacterales bacterium]|nr:MAG: rod shape-determining protein MreD [Syntrophobacterales bacterium]
MKNNLSLIGLIFLSLVVQTTALAGLPHQLAKPDLLLILIVYLGLYTSPLAGAILAFLAGYMMDIFSGSIFGVHTFSKTAIFFLTIFIKDRFYVKSPLFQGGTIFLFSIIEGVIIISILGLVSPVENLLLPFFTFIIPQSLITGFVGPFYIALIKYVSLFPRGEFIKY